MIETDFTPGTLIRRAIKYLVKELSNRISENNFSRTEK